MAQLPVRPRERWEDGIIETYKVGQISHYKPIVPEASDSVENYLKGSAFWGILQMMKDRGYQWENPLATYNLEGQGVDWHTSLAEYIECFTNPQGQLSFINRMRKVSQALTILHVMINTHGSYRTNFYKVVEDKTQHISIVIIKNTNEFKDAFSQIFNEFGNQETIYFYLMRGVVSGFPALKLTPFSWMEIGSLPALHYLQPKFRKLSSSEKAQALSTSNKYHSLLKNDIMVRYYGWEIGDLIEVTSVNPFPGINQTTVYLKMVVAHHIDK